MNRTSPRFLVFITVALLPLVLVALALLPAPLAALRADGPWVTVPVTRDTWVSAVGAEQDGNNGCRLAIEVQRHPRIQPAGRRLFRPQRPADRAGRASLAPGRRGTAGSRDGLDDCRGVGRGRRHELRQSARRRPASACRAANRTSRRSSWATAARSGDLPTRPIRMPTAGNRSPSIRP